MIGRPSCVIATCSDSARRPCFKTVTSSCTSANAGELRKWQKKLDGRLICATSPAARSAIAAR